MGAALAVGVTAPVWAQPGGAGADPKKGQAAGPHRTAGPVWIVSDLGLAATHGHKRDLDDVVSMAALKLVAGNIQIKGITLDAHPNDDCGKGKKLAMSWNVLPENVDVFSASTCGERYPKDGGSKRDESLKAMRRELSKGKLTVLNWGPMTEVAALIEQLQKKGDNAALRNLVVISNWTTPRAYNCKVDQKACDFVHNQARKGNDKGKVTLIELGDAGQKGIVEDSCHSGRALDHRLKRKTASRGLNAKWRKDWPDMSDASTVFAFMGIVDVRSNGDQPVPNLADKMCRARDKIETALLAGDRG